MILLLLFFLVFIHTIYLIIKGDESSEDEDEDAISSDEDENYGYYVYGDVDDIQNENFILQTKFKYVDDIHYYVKNFDVLNPSATLIKRLHLKKSINDKSKSKQSIQMSWNPKDHYFCLGKRDGFYMRIKVYKKQKNKNNKKRKSEDYKLIIPWCNVSYISYAINPHSKNIKICIKYSVKPIVQQLKKEETSKSKANPQNPIKQFRKKWRTISESDYPKSILEFQKYPKFMMILTPYKYQIKRIRQSIIHHSKILQGQTIHKYDTFKKNVNWNYDEQEKNAQQRIYRGSHSPYTQDHQSLRTEIKSLMFIMYDSSKGRVCKICDNKVGFFEEHPVCIKSEDTIETCDSNIIQGIHDSYFKHGYSVRKQLSLVMFVLLKCDYK